MSLAYWGTLQPVHSPDCIPPIGPWTSDNWHIISLERREGTISLGVHTSMGLWGAALPWAILHTTSLLSLSKWRGCAPSIVHNSSYLLGAHIGFAASYLLSARHISPFDFVSLSVSMAACFSCLCRETLGHFGMLISFCAHSLLMKMHISQSRD